LPARLKSSIDCSVGVTESTALCRRQQGPRAIRATTSSAEVEHALRGLAGNIWMAAD